MKVTSLESTYLGMRSKVVYDLLRHSLIADKTRKVVLPDHVSTGNVQQIKNRPFPASFFFIVVFPTVISKYVHYKNFADDWTRTGDL